MEQKSSQQQNENRSVKEGFGAAHYCHYCLLTHAEQELPHHGKYGVGKLRPRVFASE